MGAEKTSIKRLQRGLERKGPSWHWEGMPLIFPFSPSPKACKCPRHEPAQAPLRGRQNCILSHPLR